jgi:hypothetical protein
LSKSGWKSVVLGTFVTIFLGAVESGLWEIALKPGGYWFCHAVLTAATFGSKYLKDQVYLEAAKGNHEVIAENSTHAIGLILFCLAGAIIGYAIAKLKSPNLNSDETTKLSSLRHKIKIELFHNLSVILCIIYILVIYSVGELKVSAANQAYTYFRQSTDICRPYISEHQTQQFESRFAALRSRDEYVEITNELKQIAASNHLNLPEFKPW